MKTLFSLECNRLFSGIEYDGIFCINNIYYDKNGAETTKPFHWHSDDDDDEKWYQDWMEHECLSEPLKAESTTEIEWTIDDGFGNFGFKNESGEFVIEPQYAYAHNFTHGLAAVNLNRTWFKQDGRRFYENHWGYIDCNGKTQIPFQFDEAFPFNKYGVAVVSDFNGSWHLIDKKGNEIPNTRFEYLMHYYDYDERYLEFSYEYDSIVTGIYDTKERKILAEPSFVCVIVYNDDLIYVRDYKPGPLIGYFINSHGEIIYPWLYENKFSICETPGKNNIMVISKSTEVNEKYGLYSPEAGFILPTEYDKIEKLSDTAWACLKNNLITVLETDDED